MKSLECLTRRCLAGVFWLMGLVPLPPSSRLFSLFLSLTIRCCWIVYLVYLLSVGIGFQSVATESVGNVVGTMLFMGNSILGLLLLLESVLKQKTHRQLEDLRFQSQLQLQRLGMFGRGRQAPYLLPLIATQFTCDLVRILISVEVGTMISPVFMISLPLMWLLRFRYVQLVQHVMDLNQRSLQLRRSLLALATGNELWQPYGQVQEWGQLQVLRKTYGRIFECYEVLSDCFGWGMLGLHLVTSFQFVTNAYWMLMGLYQEQNVLILTFNGATGIDFGTPIATLFWYGDAGAENTQSVSIGLYVGSFVLVIMFPLSRKQALSRVVLKFLHLTLFALGLGSRRHSRPIQWLQLCCWLCWYTLIWGLTLHRATRFQDCDLDCMLRYVLLVCETGSHAIIVTNTFLQKRSLHQDDVRIVEGCDPLVAGTVMGLLVPIIGVQYLVCSNLDKFSSSVISFYWKTLPSLLGLQFQIVAFISQVMNVNLRVRLARRQLQALARELTCSWQQSKRQATYLDHQTARVVDLKRRYNELYYLFYRINENYGGSLLIIVIVFFAGFVCNAYWLFVDVRTTPSRLYPILQNLGFIFNVALQISAACWHCQQSYNLGREIGCLISKLAKPLGSKRYNNLVSEFSLQTLHQRFVVTAKDFFSLNLHLLSSMFAAVVTYLVILIQFMFAERSSKATSG